MAEISEPRIREIVRDELSVMQVPQRLASIEATLEHKADKADVESLKGEIASLREEVKGEIKGMQGGLKALEVEQRLTRKFIKTDSRILIGISIAILLLLIRDVFK
ncbi:MAG: hypothetical protein IEMM0008_1611 [bacterium]|nr:MAG: hypothetical protein IEMM0008_1611 [bacterium]